MQGTHRPDTQQTQHTNSVQDRVWHQSCARRAGEAAVDRARVRAAGRAASSVGSTRRTPKHLLAVDYEKEIFRRSRKHLTAFREQLDS